MTLNLLKITGIALMCLFLMMLPASAVPTITTTGLHPNVIQLMPTPIPDPSVLKTASAESKIMDSRVIIGNFTKQLEFLNNEMNWNLSPEQINNYSASMRNGVLKKYVYNPQYPEALDIPNQRQFYFEIGNELGLTQEESAKIVQKIEENYRKNFESTNPPSWDIQYPEFGKLEYYPVEDY
jgi:hypothetical protein